MSTTNDGFDTLTSTSFVSDLLEAGEALATPTMPDGDPVSVPYTVVPPEHTVHSLETLLGRPRRVRQTVTLTEVASFVAYTSRFANVNATLLFASVDTLRVEAVLDHPTVSQPAWGQHRAVLALKATPEWQAWLAINGKRHNQTDFAQFVEDHIPDVAEPDGASLLDMVRTLEVKKAVNYQSSVRLDNGQVQLSYIEDVTGTAAKGTLLLPERFTLGLRPFEGADLYRVSARLRYRLAEGRVALWFDLWRPEDVVRAAFNDTIARIAKDTDLPVLAGAAPALRA